MDNPETLTTLGTQDTGRNKLNKQKQTIKKQKQKQNKNKKNIKNRKINTNNLPTVVNLNDELLVPKLFVATTSTSYDVSGCNWVKVK
jgi:hypothetical protein